MPYSTPLVRSIKEKCKVCYTCVRECPAKAIRIVQGQADVLPERCIGCGNCVLVCSQNAKEVLSHRPAVDALLQSGRPVAAMLAPSFPAEFDECDPGQVAGALRAAGFSLVVEVAFGADLVSRAYRKLLSVNDGRRYIASTCPAVVRYVEHYYPGLVGALAPVASPMTATARALRQLHGPSLKTVFIGPCIAKKGETLKAGGSAEIDAVLTFVELRAFFADRGILPSAAGTRPFDPPRAGRGRLYALARGFLESAEIRDDLIRGDVVETDGRDNFPEALKEFEKGALDARFLELLCCQGCIMGAGYSRRLPLFQRRSLVSRYTRRALTENGTRDPEDRLAPFGALDLTRGFATSDQRLAVQAGPEIEGILKRMGKSNPGDELNCGACGYGTCHDHATAISKGLAEIEMCLPYTIEELRKTVTELADSNRNLAAAQDALLQSEKLASMGQLAAGIAHEVNNPLGVVLMFSNLLLERCRDDPSLAEDARMIVEQADRCRRIISGLLNFSRQNKLLLQPVSLPNTVEDALRAVKLPRNIRTLIAGRLDDPVADLDRDQIIQALFNLVTNAQAAMPDGGTLTIELSGDADRVILRVADEGIGIPAENLPKIFEPFFTTKQIGKGTGLGLAVTYGIVKMHRGEIRVESNADPRKGKTGTVFTLGFPRHEPMK